jgi:hypothetical protein
LEQVQGRTIGGGGVHLNALFGLESFGNEFREACRAAGAPGSAHGVRKIAATRAAENGAAVAELAAEREGFATARDLALVVYLFGANHLQSGCQPIKALPASAKSPNLRGSCRHCPLRKICAWPDLAPISLFTLDGFTRTPKPGSAVSHMPFHKAKERARIILADALKGNDPVADDRAVRDAPTMQELAADYLEQHAVPKKRARSVENASAQ